MGKLLQDDDNSELAGGVEPQTPPMMRQMDTSSQQRVILEKRLSVAEGLLVDAVALCRRSVLGQREAADAVAGVKYDIALYDLAKEQETVVKIRANQQRAVHRLKRKEYDRDNAAPPGKSVPTNARRNIFTAI